MRDLHLPVFKEEMCPSKALSMDEYLEFVTFNLENIVDLQANAKQKEMQKINAPFVLKEDKI